MYRYLFGLLVALGLYVTCAPAVHGQQAPASAAEAAKAPTAIERQRARAIMQNLTVRRATPVAAATTPAFDATVPAAAPPAATAPATPPSETTTTTPPASVVDALRPGISYLVKTNSREDRALWRVARANISVSNPQTLVPMSNVVRQLAEDSTELQLKAFVHLAEPLRRETDRETNTRRFVGSIQVGVIEIDARPGSTRSLSAPIHFQVLERRDADPDSVILDQTPTLKPITISVPAVTRSVVVHVVSPFTPEGFPITLTVEPTIELHTASGRIEGLGLEVADLNVSVVGLENPEGMTVTLNAEPSAHFTDSTLTLNANGNAKTQVRSSGVGKTTIRATVAGGQSESTDITFGLPFLTIAASLLGGLVGGGLRGYSGAASSNLPQHLIRGLLTGLLVFALYAVGVNVLPVQPVVAVGSVLVFAVSGLGAYLGDALLQPKGAASA